MTPFRIALAALFTISLASLGSQVQAQNNSTRVVTTCGPTGLYTAGQLQPPTQDTTGKQCSSAALSGGSVTITAPLGRAADAASVSVGLSTEDVAILNAAIPAGSAIIGKVGIDQTTPGTTNKVSLDQTTPGTTNNVTVSTNVGTLPLVQATASTPITFTGAGGPTQIIAASGSLKIYVTHIHYVVSGAGTFALITGTGTNCGTNTVYLEGASGHPLSYAANGGISAGGGIGPIYVTGAGGEICAITTGSVDTSGVISYAQF